MASAIGPPAGARLVRRARIRRHPDVGRSTRLELCRRRVVGWAAADPHSFDGRHGLRISTGAFAGARATVTAAGSAHDLRRVHRANPRGAADYGAVYGVGDAAAVSANRRDD